MKKLTFLLAPITGITAWSLFAFLIALGIVVIGLGEVLIPAPPTPTISTTASILVTNTDLHVSFRQPDGWTLIESGTQRNGPWLIPYATYGPRGYPDAPTLTIAYGDSGSQIDPGDEDIIVSNEINDAHYRGEHVVEELRERIDGLSAGGVRYTVGRKVGFRVRATQPHQTNYFEWISDVKYSDELRQIYRAMLPTIRIEPPPP